VRHTAVVLAGRRPGIDPLAAAAGTTHKCLVPVGNQPMLVRVVEALAASDAIGTIAVSIDDAEAITRLAAISRLAADGRLCILPSDITPSRSALAAAAALGQPLPLMITTADHALLTTAIAEQFIARAAAASADVVAGLAEARTVLAAFPEARRTFYRFRDGRFTGCNLYAVNSTDGLKLLEFWGSVEQSRKTPWRVVRAFGLRPLLSYLFGRLSLDEATAQASRALGVRIRTVLLDSAEAAVDVDKPDDLRLADAIMRRRLSGAA
jgi:GTP:adenosylcobinamide-phosphate guanylyltransferase